MAVIITGGSGKTSMRMTPMLEGAKIPYVLTSRRGAEGLPAEFQQRGVKFDWVDASTYDAPFESLKEPVKAIYLIAPEVANPDQLMIAFINHAYAKYNVKRFVLLAGGSTTPGNGRSGMTWRHLLDLGVQSSVMRPTWFNDNFLGDAMGFKSTIRNESKIYSAAQDGEAYFISTDDIAALAFKALTDEKPPAGDYHVLGPESLSYDDIATRLSNALGKTITHVRLSPEERKKQLIQNGLTDDLAALVVYLEGYTATGIEHREGVPNDHVERMIGRPAKKFEDWAREHKDAWM